MATAPASLSNCDQIRALLKPAYLDLQYHHGQAKPNHEAITEAIKLAKATPVHELRDMLMSSTEPADIFYILSLDNLVNVLIDKDVFDHRTIFSLKCCLEHLQFSMIRIKGLSKCD